MSSITIKTPVKTNCCKDEPVVKRVSRVYVSDNNIIGPGNHANHRIIVEYFCDSCGLVYTPTKRNRLEEFNTDHIPDLLRDTNGVEFNSEKAEALVEYLTDERWGNKVPDLKVEDISEHGSLRGDRGPDIHGLGALDLLDTGRQYWLKETKEIITWGEYKFVPKEESDLEQAPVYSKEGIALRDSHQEILAKIDRKSFEEGTARKRVKNDVPLPEDAVGFRQIYGPWDNYKKSVVVPECFV